MEDQGVLELVFCDDKCAFVAKPFLQKHYDDGSLTGADIFAALFNLTNCSLHFKKCHMETNDDGQVTLLQYLSISFHDWSCFVKFLKTQSFITMSTLDIERLHLISTKLGGIPSIDACFEQYCNREKELQRLKILNPMRPSDDIEGLYTWGTFLKHDFPPSCGYSVTCDSSISCVYGRKKKDKLLTTDN